MVEIIYENKGRLNFFEAALKEIDVECRLNDINDLKLDLTQPPDDIVYLNRIRSSSGKNHTLINGEQYLEYLATYNRRVINDYRTFNYEISRVEQLRLFKRNGLTYPQTLFGSEKDELLSSAKKMPTPFVVKHNCPGNSDGTRLFEDVASFEKYLNSDNFIPSPDGVLLLQEFIKPKNDRITRIEFLNGKFIYAYYQSNRFKTNQITTEYLPDYKHQLVKKYIEIAMQTGYDIAGFEFVEATNGAVYTYKIIGTTDYISEIEKTSGDRAKNMFQEFIKELT